MAATTNPDSTGNREPGHLEQGATFVVDRTPGMQRRGIVIDTDTASDDAVALVLAVREATVDVRAVTVVAGNVPLELAEPMAQPLNTAQFVHGADGMGGAMLPEPSRAVTSDDAVGALLSIAEHEAVTTSSRSGRSPTSRRLSRSTPTS